MKQRGIIRRTAGFTFGEMLCVLGVVSVVVIIGMVLPMMARSRPHSPGITCINNLKQIDLALKQWALDHNGTFPMAVSATNGGAMEATASGRYWEIFLVMSNELNTPKILICPGEVNPQRTMATSWHPRQTAWNYSEIPFTNNANVSYFISLSVEGDENSRSILLGDSHLQWGGKPVPPGRFAILTNALLGWQKPSKPGHQYGGNIAMADGSAAQTSDARLRELVEETGVTNNVWGIP